jgi:hypothetical protein
MKITEARLKELITEEVELYLLKEELVYLDEGIMKYLDKLFGRREAWEDLVDDWDEDGKVEKELFLGMPSRKKILALGLLGFIGAAGTEIFGPGGVYQQSSAAEKEQIERFQDGLDQARERSAQVANFRKMAWAGAEGASAISSQSQVDNHIDDIRQNYSLERATIGASPGLFIDGDPDLPAAGFAYVPADQISDDTILPFVGMTKADYEMYLRMAWLPQAGGDQDLRDFVTGGGRQGTSVLWSYQDNLFAPVMSYSSDIELQQKMIDYYGEISERTLILPLEWSVAKGLVDTRAAR